MRISRRRFHLPVEQHEAIAVELREAARHLREALRLLADCDGVKAIRTRMFGLCSGLTDCAERLHLMLKAEHPEASDLYHYSNVENVLAYQYSKRSEASAAPHVYVVDLSGRGKSLIEKYGMPR